MERVCKDCGLTITNLERQVGQTYSDPATGQRWIRCMDCRPGMRRDPLGVAT